MRITDKQVVPAPHCEPPPWNPWRPHGEPAARTGLRATTGDGGVGVAGTDDGDGEGLYERYPTREILGYPWVASTTAESGDATAGVGRGNWLTNGARW